MFELSFQDNVIPVVVAILLITKLLGATGAGTVYAIVAAILLRRAPPTGPETSTTPASTFVDAFLIIGALAIYAYEYTDGVVAPLRKYVPA